jgi:demethylmenaquinone methyltransferase/2-methoxy-6-polyprenyl-1,4-benzoquinol methylase
MTTMHDDLGSDKTPGRIAGMFDAIAPYYDRLNRVLSAGTDRRWRKRAVRALGLHGGETVLDLCTGTADLAIAATMGPRGAKTVIGIDFARAMLERAALKLAPSSVKDRIRLVQGDATRIPLRSSSVDAAMVAFGLRNVSELELSLREGHRVLRPGGTFVILEFAIPTLPVLRQAYLAYFRHVLPWVGRTVSGHDSAYRYLPASVGVFPAPAAVATLLGASGFLAIVTVPLTLGIVYLYRAQTAPARSRTRP